MHILIKIEDGKTRLSLIENEKERDFVEIVEEKTLSERLLPEIDGLIKKNNLKSQDIEEIRVESDKSDSFTTTRIAKSVANVWNFRFIK